MKFETFIHAAPIFDPQALRQVLADARLDTGKAPIFEACLAALLKRYEQYRRGVGFVITNKRRGLTPETRWAHELHDVYKNLGGKLGKRSLGFYSFARGCAACCEIKIGPHKNFESNLHRTTLR